MGQWDRGEMAMVFVGALNAGSISLAFDPELATNAANPYRKDYGFRRNYETGIRDNSSTPTPLNLADNTVLRQLATRWEEEKKEFDVDDMVDEEVQRERREQKLKKLCEIAKESKTELKLLDGINYFYSKKDEFNLEYNLYNGFKSNQERAKQREQKYEYEDKVREARSFVETGAGIFMKKGIEMGKFN
eukprot:TRINITY_DN8801_c0_g1_i2.p2 TRINITY_DN8801_c0_g1~~TRINITY_DN8801_c0_g1_i2.p2  ORF type:complete len:189 (+),score=72.19 TRINITY_DN8801_c0_g1_i2:908-1474(+)